MQRTISILIAFTLGILGCTKGPKAGSSGGAAEDDGKGSFALCGQATKAAEYLDFGGRNLAKDRISAEEIPSQGDRARLKPFSALEAEFRRVTGQVPSELQTAAATFNSAPPRWFREPQASGISLFVAYNLAFEVAKKKLEAQEEYKQTPNPDSAAAACTQFATEAWLAEPSPSEVKYCTDLVMNEDSGKTNVDRWAHGLSAILTASRFLGY